jgi:alkanesulfonate monooxygenase SsuD/methylene tetrahydromethanopterin reductase-like flavin-dependent oxidoreductase (luciferase family)
VTRFGIFVAPFGELSEPAVVAGLAQEAEAAGWDGFFLWDHVAYREPVREIADPWITLAAIAARTERLVIGPLVTPLPRRRPHQLARETVTLDRLSGGRLVLGVGVGSENTVEFRADAFGEEPDMKARAALLDDGLERLQAYWGGAFEPRPVGRIPIWVAARWPNRRPLRRAARHEGVFPIDQSEPAQLAEMVAAIAAERGSLHDYDVVVTNPAGTDPQPWIDAGATWCLTGFGIEPTVDDVRAAISAGGTTGGTSSAGA